jgi:hypothetical protein
MYKHFSKEWTINDTQILLLNILILVLITWEDFSLIFEFITSLYLKVWEFKVYTVITWQRPKHKNILYLNLSNFNSDDIDIVKIIHLDWTKMSHCVRAWMLLPPVKNLTFMLRSAFTKNVFVNLVQLIKILYFI